jgi:hypothetical protein
MIRFLSLAWLISVLLFLNLLGCENHLIGPDSPEGHPVTFRGRAFLVGQPAAINHRHLPLHYDIEIISFLPGDSTSYDTTYTDSGGVFVSTRVRQDGLYKIVSRFPYYNTDTVEVEVKRGKVVEEIPRLFSERLQRIQVFTDSLTYHSLHSGMFFTQYVSNLSQTDTLGAPRRLIRWLIPKDNLSVIYQTQRAPNIDYLIALLPLEVKIYQEGGLLNYFYDRVNQALPSSGIYYLYAIPEPWPRIGSWYPHYRKSVHWFFKVSEPTVLQIDLE